MKTEIVYQGKGNHSVNTLETIIEQLQENLHLKQIELQSLSPLTTDTDEALAENLMKEAMKRTIDEFCFDKLEIGFHDTIIKWVSRISLVEPVVTDETIKSVTNCPTCGSECFVGGNGTTHFYIPKDKVEAVEKKVGVICHNCRGKGCVKCGWAGETL